MKDELIEEKEDLMKKIMSMEWDKNQNQLNFAKESVLEECKKRLEEINKELENG